MSEAPPYVIITTTVDSEEASESISEAVLGPRLAACVQATPVKSTFWWQGLLQHTAEIRLQFKAPAENTEAIMAAIESVHPYEVPEIIVTPILDGHPPYLEWIGEESQPREDTGPHPDRAP